MCRPLLLLVMESESCKGRCEGTSRVAVGGVPSSVKAAGGFRPCFLAQGHQGKVHVRVGQGAFSLLEMRDARAHRLQAPGVQQPYTTGLR